MAKDLDNLVSELKKLKRVLIATHVYPDPDAVGSSCGLAQGLKSIGIDSTVYFPEKLPPRLVKLSDGVKVVNSVPTDEYSAVIVVDNAAKKRVGGEMEALFARAKMLINIDHHFSNENYGTINYVDADAAAAAQIIYTILEKLGAKISAETASVLYAGLMDDTGSFRFANADGQALHTAAKLVELGASPSKMANYLYFSIPMHVLKLRAVVLSRLKLLLDGKVALLSVTENTINECGAQPEDSEGLVDEARVLEGVICAVFIRQITDGWKVSLRSKDESLDVSALAGLFGGGGHKMAAGYKRSGALEKVESELIEKLTAVIK